MYLCSVNYLNNNSMISREKIAKCFAPFEGVESDYDRRDIHNKVVTLPKYDNGGYFVLFDKMAERIRSRLIKLNSNDFAVLMSIMFHLEFNSNIVRVTYKEISNETNIEINNISSHISKLRKARFIIKDGNDIIVNVNYLFKGDLLEFYRAYKEYYPEDKGIIYR